MESCQFYVNEWVTSLGGATCILTCTSYTGSEFSEKVVRMILTNKTVSW